MKRPSFQFYPADWRKDMALQSCSVAARGLWIDCMCIAHECKPYGHLTVNGNAMTSAQISRHTGVSARECQILLDELERAGVLSRTDQGVVYSRRMVRDEIVREARAQIGREHGAKGAEFGKLGAEHGAKGGRPPAHKPTADTATDIPGSQPGLEPPQNPRPSSSSSPTGNNISEPSAPRPLAMPSDPPRKPKPTIPCPYHAIVDAYHRELPSLAKVKLRDGPMWADRQKAMRGLWGWVLSSRKSDGERRAENGDQALEWFTGYFGRARDNDFVMGRTPRGPGHETWHADFDFLLTKKGVKQVIEKTTKAAA